MSSNADPLAGAAPPSAEPGLRAKTKCEFCECELGKSGEYMRLSDKARKLRKLEEENTALEGTIATLRHENEELKAEKAARTPPATTTRSGLKL
jgi:hypothetical protein